MNTEVDQLKKSFSKAVLWILLLLAAATGTTYAWFSLTGMHSTNVTPMAGTVSQGDTVLMISTNEGGPFDKTCDLVLSGNPESLKPLSTADLEHFYQILPLRIRMELRYFTIMRTAEWIRMPCMGPSICSVRMHHVRYILIEKN